MDMNTIGVIAVLLLVGSAVLIKKQREQKSKELEMSVESVEETT